MLFVCAASALHAQSATSSPAPPVTAPPVQQEKPKPIQDNSFLVEEAYNQEKDVVQHISAFQRNWRSHDWEYTFTQEWPVNFAPRHQLSFTIPVARSGAFGDSGFGDIALNYRYQLIGSGDARVAFAPRASFLIASGDATTGRGSGGNGIQFNLPLSVVTHDRLVTHWNAGMTVVPNAENELGDQARSVGTNVGGSLIFLAHQNFNLMLEAVWERSQAVIGPGQTRWENEVFISPGFRWAHNLSSGLQIVPGIAVPFGVGRARGERGLVLYLSFEHAFKK
jgi:hypothetical protein